MINNRIQVVQQLYDDFMSGDRKFYEEHLSDDFTFSSPVDVGLDKDGYFRRCWPGAGKGGRINYVRLIESANEVVATYESIDSDGNKGRNTEIIGFNGEKVSTIEVYFGWSENA